MEGLVIPDPKFWSGRRVLVTGHTGFKGAWLVRWLERLGAELTGYSLPPNTEPNLSSLLSRARVEAFADVRDRTAVAEAVHVAAPEIVFHLAAQAFVLESIRRPHDTFATNVLGTVNVLDAALLHPTVRSVLVVTSDKVYRAGTNAHTELDALGGDDPYSASKAAAELVVHAYRSAVANTSGVSLVSARAGNVIGGGDWGADRIVPDVVRAFMAERAPELRNPDAVRPWQHVLEPLRGYLLLAERATLDSAAVPDAMNFGPADSSHCAVGELVDRFSKRWPGARAWIAPAATRAHENPCLRLDSSRAATELAWRPALDLDGAIAWTSDWYARWAAGADVGVLCDEQIDEYTRRST